MAESQVSTQNDSIHTEQLVESTREITHDVIEYLVEYARANPGYAALWCLGAGFVLGWKLKPW